MPSQCVYNAHYMRSSCQKSCEVVPVCKDISRYDPWKGLATADGTSKRDKASQGVPGAWITYCWWSFISRWYSHTINGAWFSCRAVFCDVPWCLRRSRPGKHTLHLLHREPLNTRIWLALTRAIRKAPTVAQHFRRDPAMGTYYVEGIYNTIILHGCSIQHAKKTYADVDTIPLQGDVVIHKDLPTPALLSSLPPAGQQMRGAPWLHLSSLGIGTYLGDADDATDAQASRL